MNRLSAYIIAYNEKDKIAAAVNSVLWADEIVVADSFSTDPTAAIAASMGARVVQIAFEGFGPLRNQAIAACRHEWIFSLDADERCTPPVRDEILAILAANPAHDVYFVPRRNFFMGRWITHSGFYPNYRQPQLFRKGALTYTNDPVHEGFVMAGDKPPGYLRSAIWQVPFAGFDQIQAKAARYSTLGAARLAAEGRRAGMGKALARGLWSFFQHYVLKRGVLDGWAGFVIALGNFEGTFYKYAKLCQMRADWQPPASPPLTRPGATPANQMPPSAKPE
jgi:glycosyltransferase involved in cell wall biosynthesis